MRRWIVAGMLLMLLGFGLLLFWPQRARYSGGDHACLPAIALGFPGDPGDGPEAERLNACRDASGTTLSIGTGIVVVGVALVAVGVLRKRARVDLPA
jgi:hypothetical protein